MLPEEGKLKPQQSNKIAPPKTKIKDLTIPSTGKDVKQLKLSLW